MFGGGGGFGVQADRAQEHKSNAAQADTRQSGLTGDGRNINALPGSPCPLSWTAIEATLDNGHYTTV